MINCNQLTDKITNLLEKEFSLLAIVKNNTAFFDFYQDEVLYYYITVNNKDYNFPVPINDTGQSVFKGSEKAIHLMRWIRKALENGTFVERYK